MANNLKGGNKMKLKKNIYIILIILLVISCTFSVFATGGTMDIGEFTDKEGISEVDSQIQSVSVKIITAVRIGAVTIALAVLLTIAMKYMVSSAGDRADIKKHAIAYVTGAVILFAVSGILGMIEEFAGLIETGEGEPTPPQ